MKLVNNVVISVFIKESENEDVLREKLKSFVPLSFEDEKITLTRKIAEGFEDKKIIILEIVLNKEKHTNAFIKKLNKILVNEQKELILRQAETRLDREFNFFIRFDKEKLVNENKYWITDSGNCFHIKMNIACFPRKREQALKIIQNIFK